MKLKSSRARVSAIAARWMAAQSCALAVLSFIVLAASAKGATPEVTAAVTAASAGPCPTIPAAQTAFLTTDSAVWFDFSYTGGQAEDLFIIEWFEPNGTIDTRSSYIQTGPSASYCYSYSLPVAGYPPASLPGTWTVKLLWNSTQIAAATFTIGAPPATPQITAAVTAAIGGSCPVPTAKTAFLTTDGYVWFDFSYTGGTARDAFQIQWIEPNGAVENSDNFTQPTTGGTNCYNYNLSIAGYPPATLPGSWTVKLLWNGTQIFSAPFTISAPSTAATPTISSITPNPITVNSPATPLTIQGTGLLGTSAYPCSSPATTVSWNGTLLTITSSSATQVVATVPASLLTTIGTYPVTVTAKSSTNGICSNLSTSGSVQVVASSSGGGGSLGVSTANVSFSDAGGVASGSQTFSVTSSSGSISYGISTSYNSPSCANWINLSRTSGVASPGSPSSVTASLNSAVLLCSAGQYTATLTITGGTTGSAVGPRGSTPAPTILVTLNKSNANGITAQTTMVFGALTGALAPFSSPQDSQVLQINTVTGANLNYAYAIAQDQQGSVLPCSAAQTTAPTAQTAQTPQWLTVSPAYVAGLPLTAPGVLTVSVQPLGLAPGTYVDDINFGDQYGNSATVRVYLVVASTATNEYSFSYVSGGSQPAAQGFGPFADNCPSSASNTQVGASSDQGWLGVSASVVSLSPTASFMITATPSSSMSPGMYYGTVILTDTDGQAVLISCTLTVTAAPTQTTSVLPQFVFDGGWYSALYFTNVTGTAASFPVNFVSDAATPLNVPTGSSTQASPAAYGTAIIEAPDGGGATVNQGYAEFALPSGVQGYGVFRQAGQEAVVPFSAGNATTNTLTFDDTGPLVTSVAIVNSSSVPATVVITLWNAAGTIIGSSSVALGPNSKTEKELRLLPGLSGMVGNRGTAQFTVSSGSVAVLGLRFNGAAFTSIPTTSAAPSNSGSSILSQFAFDGGWYSALYFSNPTGTAVSFPVNFVSDAGTPLSVPTGSSTQVRLPAYGTAIIEAPDGGGATVNEGYAEFTLPTGVYGYGVFRQAGQEAVVPFSQGNATSNTLTFDDTGPLVTSVAIDNPSSSPTNVVITLWNAVGTIIGTSTVSLGANTKTEKELRLLPGLSGIVGNRGTAQFAVSSGSVAVLGLRFNGTAFTSIPTTNP